MFSDTYFFIPARKGSKGFPYKNRFLFEKTANIIPKELSKNVYVSTDDEEIEKKSNLYNFNLIKRPEYLSSDTASVKDVLQHFVEHEKIDKKNIIMLYLTYPQRTWEDVCNIYEFYKENLAKSLVCCEKTKEHPYLMFYKNDHKISPIIEHKLYRRQDYPYCVKLSLYVGIYDSGEIKNLKDLLYNQETLFYEMKQEKIDVDYKEDYINLIEEK